MVASLDSHVPHQFKKMTKRHIEVGFYIGYYVTVYMSGYKPNHGCFVYFQSYSLTSCGMKFTEVS